MAQHKLKILVYFNQEGDERPEIEAIAVSNTRYREVGQPEPIIGPGFEEFVIAQSGADDWMMCLRLGDA